MKMNEDISVSILCVAYNQESYIRQCLDSLLMQKTNFGFEILVHDDASTDGTQLIIKEYELRYPDIIKPIYQVENQYSKGISPTLQYNLPRAKGKYVAMCEGDDYWIDPLKLQRQFDFLEVHPECGLVYTNVNVYFQSRDIIDERSLTQGCLRLNHSNSYEDHLVKGGYIAPCTWMYRRALAEKFSDNSGYTDFSFSLALDIWANSNIHFMDEVTAVYRVSDNSVSHPKDVVKVYHYLSDVFSIKRKYIAKYPHLVSADAKGRIYREGYYSIIKFAVLLNEREVISDAKKYLNHSIKALILSRLYFIPLVKRYIKHTLKAGGYVLD